MKPDFTLIATELMAKCIELQDTPRTRTNTAVLGDQRALIAKALEKAWHQGQRFAMQAKLRQIREEERGCL